jgi:hypothetical protein
LYEVQEGLRTAAVGWKKSGVRNAVVIFIRRKIFSGGRTVAQRTCKTKAQVSLAPEARSDRRVRLLSVQQ